MITVAPRATQDFFEQWARFRSQLPGLPPLEPRTAAAVKRTTEANDKLTTAAIQQAFGGPKGFAAVADGADQSKIVLVVEGSTIPPYFSGAPDMKDTEDRLSGDIANDFLQQYVTQLQQKLGVAVNQATLQRLIGGAGPG